MNKETYEKFCATGTKIIEINDNLTETIAALKADCEELSKMNIGSDNNESVAFVKGRIRELEVAQHNSYLAYIILHDKILELNNIIILERELEKALRS